MLKWVFLLIALAVGVSGYGQIVDDFDRPELEVGGANWMGELNKFIINDQQELQMNDSEAGNSSLFLPFSLSDSTQWDIYFRMEFNPSSSNRLRIYLLTQDSVLTDSDAYFLDIGENGNDDPIYFVRRVDGEETVLAAMELGAVAFEPAEARINILYDGDETWQLNADYEGESLFADRLTLEVPGPEFDSGFFGLHCSYTVTRANLFFFDDLRIGNWVPDTTPPELIHIRPLAHNSVELTFDKLLEEQNVLQLNHYFIEELGNPNDVFFNPGEGNRVELFFDNEFENGREYTLEIDGLSDLNGNVINTEKSFIFILPEFPMPGDIVINEIHSLPSGTTLIPNIKYIELFNSSDKFLELEGVTFSDRSRTATLPQFVMAPGDFLLLSQESDSPLLESYGAVIGLSDFPTINNNNDDIELRTAMGELMFAVSYRPGWFDHPLKAEGGYSLELINPTVNCQTRINWGLSESNSGGSPGQASSILDENHFPSLPRLIYGTYADDGILGLHFNSELDRRTQSFPPEINIEPEAGPFQILYDPLDPQAIQLFFEEQPVEGVNYVVEADNLRSCAHQPWPGAQEYPFKLPGLPESGEVVINEILYHPLIGIRDFIELKNTEEEDFYRLSDLLFYHRRSSGAESTFRSDIDRLIPPGELLTLGRETHLLELEYHVENPDGLHSLDLMALDVNSGTVTLSAFHPGELVYLDSIEYSAGLHDPLIRNTRGISLERTDPDLHPSFPAAWYSAATITGGATPTAENSQKRQVLDGEEKEEYFFLNSRTFSPNGDGFEDFLQIEYRIDDPGYVANIRIFDMNGHRVRDLVRNQSLGTEGVIRWSGENNNGEKLKVGIYVILIEMHHISGDRKKQRLTAVLADQL
nr:lamin tail domain-containing protein [Saprospiraceae bacterium]